MGPTNYQQHLIAEVSHQINSPLAAIRNALYLAAQRSDDPQVLRYLQIADQEIEDIVNRIKDLRESVEAESSSALTSVAPFVVHSFRKAA
jgi:signal transduction histidine kinase